MTEYTVRSSLVSPVPLLSFIPVHGFSPRLPSFTYHAETACMVIWTVTRRKSTLVGPYSRSFVCVPPMLGHWFPSCIAARMRPVTRVLFESTRTACSWKSSLTENIVIKCTRNYAEFLLLFNIVFYYRRIVQVNRAVYLSYPLLC